MDYSKEHNQKKQKSSKAHTRKVQNKVGIIAFRVVFCLVLIGGFASVGGLVGAYFGIIQNAPRIEPVKIQPTAYTSILLDNRGQEIGRLSGEENREYVPLERIPLVLQQAFIAIEDERFFSHNGIDPRGIVRAIVNNLTTDSTEGASTITQQVIKNNVLNIPRNTFFTKLQEQFLAIEYERGLVELYGGDRQRAKEHILEVYLNTINLAHGLNGVQTASLFYFGKDVSEITVSEAAVLAAITQSPTRFSPVRNPQNNAQRRESVLNSMLRLGFITEREHRDALNDDVYARVIGMDKMLAQQATYHSYFVDTVVRTVARDLASSRNISITEAFNLIYTGGLRIHTTKDSAMQQIMDDVFESDEYFPNITEVDVQYYISIRNTATGELRHYHRRNMVGSMSDVEAHIQNIQTDLLGTDDVVESDRIITVPQPQAAMVVLDFRTGEVKAVRGGRGPKQTNLALNRAVEAPRSPGSVFKVVASFAPSMDLGISSPSTLIDNSRLELNGWAPRNWNDQYGGAFTLRDAMRDSMNVVSVRNMMNTGLDASFSYLLNFGFTTLENTDPNSGRMFTDRYNPAIALGGLTYGVTQLEVTAAFGAIANNGEYIEPIFYTRVYDHDNNILLDNSQQQVRRQVLRPPTAYMLTDMMLDVVIRGTGTQARFRNLNMAVAGKTGTSQEARDLTFVGYTPYLAAGIWLGFDQPRAMRDGRHHLNIWREVMERIHMQEDFSVVTTQFSRPEGIISATVCGVSGRLAVSGLCNHDVRGSALRTDFFMIGDQPTEYCHMHARVTICVISGQRAGSSCPTGITRTFVGVLPTDDQTEFEHFHIRPEWLGGPVCNMYHPPEHFHAYVDEYGYLHFPTPSEEYSPHDTTNGYELPADNFVPSTPPPWLTPQPDVAGPPPTPSPSPPPPLGAQPPMPTPPPQAPVPTPTPVPEFPTPTPPPMPTPTPAEPPPQATEPAIGQPQVPDNF